MRILVHSPSYIAAQRWYGAAWALCVAAVAARLYGAPPAAGLALAIWAIHAGMTGLNRVRRAFAP